MTIKIKHSETNARSQKILLQGAEYMFANDLDECKEKVFEMHNEECLRE